MSTFKLNLEDLYLLSEDDLCKILTNFAEKGKMIYVDTATPIIAEPHSNLDLASEYLRILVLGETIAPLCEKICWEEVIENNRAIAARFILMPKDSKKLAKKLYWFSSMAKMLDEPEDLSWNPINTDTSEYEDLKYLFGDDLSNKVHYFPDLAESSVRNLIVGLSEMYHDKELQDIYSELRVVYARWWDVNLEFKE